MKLVRQALDVGIVTRNREAMLAFYGDVLGLAVSAKMTLPGIGSLTKIDCGESVIKLLEPESTGDVAPHMKGYLAATGIRYFALTVADIRKTVDDCRKAGVAIVTDVITVRAGVQAAMVEDPDGNAIEFMQQG